MITPNQIHNLAKKSFSLFEKINDVCLKDLVICSCGAKKKPKYYETKGIVSITKVYSPSSSALKFFNQ